MMHYVVLKLITGEQVMASVMDEDISYIELDNPLVIKMVPFVKEGRTHEHVTASPLCQFSDETMYRIPKSSIMFIKTLHDVMVPHYTRLVEELSNTVLVRNDSSGTISRIGQDDEEEEEGELTIDEINRRIEMLEAIAKAPVVRDKEKEEEEPTFIDGNDTLH